MTVEATTTRHPENTQARDGDDPLALVKRARRGDTRAQQALLEKHRPRVIAIARRYVRPHVRLDDLVQEGFVGLLSALEGFDVERGVTFWTYAHYWVAYRVQRHAFENRRIVRPPRTRVSRRIRGTIRTTRHELAAELGRDPRRAELAEALGVGDEDLAAYEATQSAKDVHLEQRQSPDVPWEGRDPEELSAQREHERARSRALREAMRHLDEREAAIVERRFLEPDGDSYATLGRDFQVSRERIRQLSVRALGKMRARLDERGLGHLMRAEAGVR